MKVPDSGSKASESVVISRHLCLLCFCEYIIKQTVSFGMHTKCSFALKLCSFCTVLLLMLVACGATPAQVDPQQTVTVSGGFQSQASPIPTIPTYRCGAWSSNNAPGPNSTITIYAKITKDLAGVSGATATAVVHFEGGDQELDQHPASDNGGYVTFTLNLQGRQPVSIPATVDVTFSSSRGTLKCTPAFFTPI
jgi:hypothetical protein